MQVSSVLTSSGQSAKLGSNDRMISTDVGREQNAELYELQDTFTAVLAEVGREGYASATPAKSDAPLDASIVASWNQWFDEVGRSAYQDVTATNSS